MVPGDRLIRQVEGRSDKTYLILKHAYLEEFYGRGMHLEQNSLIGRTVWKIMKVSGSLCLKAVVAVSIKFARYKGDVEDDLT